MQAGLRRALTVVSCAVTASGVIAATDDASLEEIVVTAQKRSERLLDVPASVSAVTGDRLQSLQVNSLSDLANYVPGLSVAAGGAPGFRTIVLRGLSTSYSNATTGPLVGTYVDDLSVGNSTAGARGAMYGLDLNPYDVDHVEVIKGPQGTLYGANTMGGLVKYVLRKPELANFGAQMGVDSEDTDGSGKPSWGTHGAVNLPILTDTLAVLISGFFKNDAGYVDNAALGTQDVNHSTESGGLATLLWQATDRLAVRAAILTQDIDAANMTEVTLNGATLQPLHGRFTTNSLFPQPYEQSSRIYSVSVDGDLDFATLTNSTGWSRLNSADSEDYTVPFGAYCAPGSLFPGWAGCPTYPHANALAPFFLSLRVSRFVEEFRLASPADQRVQWMLGGYYSKEDSSSSQYIPTFTPSYVPLPAADLLALDVSNSTYKESAGFANITYEFNERFDISGGERYSAYSQGGCTPTSEGLLGSGPSPCTTLPSTGVSVWMASARFHLNQQAMLYARVATGYRPGGGCPTCGDPKLGIPGVVNPDNTTNYEAGFKGSFFDQRLQMDMAAFHIDWNHIQLNQLTPQGIVYAGNGGTAVSNGFELSAAYQFTEALRLNATIGYTNAHLTQDAPGADGKSGDQLPESPRLTGSATTDYGLPLDGRETILFGAGYRYRDAIVNQFAHTPFASMGGSAPIGPQNIVDLYTGMAMQTLKLRLYARNVFNNQSYTGLLFINNPQEPRFVPVQPRTIGLSADYQF